MRGYEYVRILQRETLGFGTIHQVMNVHSQSHMTCLDEQTKSARIHGGDVPTLI